MPKYLPKYPLWVIFKIFFFELINDFFALFALILLPILISIIWILLTEYNYVDQVPNTSRFSDPLTLWYDFTVIWIFFISLNYFALKFANLHKTTLFRKILVAQISSWKIITVSLSFFFLFSLLIGTIKFGLLMYYSVFHQEISNAQIMGLLSGFFLLILTSLSLGFLFANLPVGSTTLNLLIFTIPFCLLFMGGFFINIENLLLFKELREEGIQSWTKISKPVQTYRNITHLSPFQPSLQIIKASHSNDNWSLKLLQNSLNPNSMSKIYYRPMIYDNYATPIFINLGWILVINQINILLFNKSNQ